MKRDSDQLAPATISEADGVRYLHLGTPWVQGAMRMKKPQAIELEYVRRMMVWLLLRDEAAMTGGHAVQLGLGAATLTRFCHHVLRMKTSAVELNPSVIAACRAYFHLNADAARLKIVQGDAAHWIADARHAGKVDVLNVDLYDQHAAAPALDDEAFYAGCQRALAEGGLMTVNLFGRNAAFERSARRIAAAFGTDQVWTMSPTREDNTIVLAANGVAMPDRETLEVRAASIESRFGLPARKWPRMLRALPAPRARASR